MALLRTSSVTLGRPGAKALSTKCLFVETSAKTGAGVQSLFTKVCVAVFFADVSHALQNTRTLRAEDNLPTVAFVLLLP